MGSHDDEDMLELRPDVGDEGKGTRLLQHTVMKTMMLTMYCWTYLKHNGDNIIANVTFPGQLLCIVFASGRKFNWCRFLRFLELFSLT